MKTQFPANVEMGARIRQARKALGLTVVQLAQRVGVTHGAISKYETGKLGASAETLRKIAAATETDVFALIGGQADTEYMAITVPVEAASVGVECPWEKVEVPVYWPGTMREFISSGQAELAQLGPDEVAGLAQVAMFLGPPVDEAGWMRLLAWVRMFKGAKGRPIYMEMQEASDDQ